MLILLILSFYTTLISSLLEPFNCVLLDGVDTFVIASNPSERCFTEEWYDKLGFVIVFGSLYFVVLPGILIWILMKYRGRFETLDFINRFGALTRSYRPEYFYWELVEIMRKASIVICIDFLTLTSSVNTRILIIYGLLMTYSFLVILCKPFRREYLNTLNIWWSLVPGAITISIAVFENANVSEDEKNKLAAAAISVVVILITATIVVNGYVIRERMRLARATNVEADSAVEIY